MLIRPEKRGKKERQKQGDSGEGLKEKASREKAFRRRSRNSERHEIRKGQKYCLTVKI